MPIAPASLPRRRWALLKGLIIIGGSLVAAVYTVANVFALYYAKAYLLDRPALTVNMQLEQIGSSDEHRYLPVTLAFENNGVRPYDLTLKGLKPITIGKVSKNGEGELSFLSAREADLAAERLSGRQIRRHPRHQRHYF